MQRDVICIARVFKNVHAAYDLTDERRVYATNQGIWLRMTSHGVCIQTICILRTCHLFVYAHTSQ
jgi:hypothetical protein